MNRPWHPFLYPQNLHVTNDCCLSPMCHLSEHFNIFEVPYAKGDISLHLRKCRSQSHWCLLILFSKCHFYFCYEFSSVALGYKHPLYQDWQCQRFWWWRELRVRDRVCVERLPGSRIQLPVQEWQPYPGASCRDALRQQGRGKTWNKTTQAHTESQQSTGFFPPRGSEIVWYYYSTCSPSRFE